MNAGLPTSSVPAGGKLASSSGPRTQTSTKNHTHHSAICPIPGQTQTDRPGLCARNNQHNCSRHALRRLLCSHTGRSPKPSACPGAPRAFTTCRGPAQGGHRWACPLPSAWEPLLLPLPRALSGRGNPSSLQGHLRASSGVSSFSGREHVTNQGGLLTCSKSVVSSRTFTPFQPLSPAAPPSASEAWQTPVHPSEHPSGVAASTKPPQANWVTPAVGPPLPVSVSPPAPIQNVPAPD